MATRNKSAKPAAKAPRVEIKNEVKKKETKSASASKPGSFRDGTTITPAKGKLGVMIPGMGAVATTFVAGVEAIRKGLAKPIGSLTQMGTVRLGKRTDGRRLKSSFRWPGSTIWSLLAGTFSKTTCTKPLPMLACLSSGCSTS
jgi:hypothetical protein